LKGKIDFSKEFTRKRESGKLELNKKMMITNTKGNFIKRNMENLEDHLKIELNSDMRSMTLKRNGKQTANKHKDGKSDNTKSKPDKESSKTR